MEVRKVRKVWQCGAGVPPAAGFPEKQAGRLHHLLGRLPAEGRLHRDIHGFRRLVCGPVIHAEHEDAQDERRERHGNYINHVGPVFAIASCHRQLYPFFAKRTLRLVEMHAGIIFFGKIIDGKIMGRGCLASCSLR